MNRFTAMLFCLICSSAAIASWETSSFRTSNGQLVRLGMTKAEVRRDAGAPLDRPKAASGKTERSAATKKRGDVWIYKGGDGVYSIFFSADRVAKIEVAPFRGLNR